MAEKYDFHVHDNRKITFNLTEPIMREDSGVTDFVFYIPKVLNGLEVSDWQWWLVFVNAKKEKYSIALTLSEDPERPLEFNYATYTVDYAMSIKAGSVQFALEAINAGTGGAIDNEWHTQSYEIKVKETLQGNQAEYAETESDVISELLQNVRTKMNQVIGGATPTPAQYKAQMIDPQKVYLYIGSEPNEYAGHWYYHNGTTFVSGGVYGAGVVDLVPTQGSTNAVSSGGVYSALNLIDTGLLNNVDKYKFSGSPTAYNARDLYIEYAFLEGHRYRISLTFNQYTPAETLYKWRVELCDDKSGSNPVNEQHTTIAPDVGTTAVIDFVAESAKPYAQIRLYTLAGYDFDVDIVFDCYGMETIESIKNAIETSDKKEYADHKIVNVDWKYFGRWDYPTGWRQGYYATATGVYTNNGGYMCTVKYIDLTGIDKIIATPPEGYAVAFVFFKSDGSLIVIGNANTTSHPENVDRIWDIDTDDYVKCGITVGRFPNTAGQKGADYALDETFVNSVDMTVYYKTRNRIYDYYASEMEQTILSVRDSITEPALVFPVITDIHYLSQTGSFNHGVENIREFCKRVKVDFVLNLGDNTDGNIAPAYTILRNMFMLDRFTEINAPYYQAIGNHDVNGYKSTEELTPEEIYKSYLSNTHGVRFDMTAGETNYYKDFDELGIRLIVLDIDHNAGWTYSNNTVAWLRDTALDTSNIVILAEHMSSIPTQNWNGASVVNGTGVTAVLQAFVNGGGKLIQICGHSHADYYFTTPWLTIFTVCQKFEKADVTDPNYSEDIQGNVGDIVAPDRTEFTASEDAWTVFIIKPVSGKVDAIRFGAGSDMHYDF